jgi:uncharacterized membrane protein
MRRLLKFLHTMGAIGLMGAMACLLVLVIVAPPPTSLAEYASLYGAMAKIASWILFPSLALTLVGGLLAMAWNNAFLEAGWVWAKLGTGVLIFEGGLVYVQGPIKEEAERSAAALAGHPDAAIPLGSYGAEPYSLWLLLAVAAANVVLGVWRPRFSARSRKGPMTVPARRP